MAVSRLLATVVFIGVAWVTGAQDNPGLVGTVTRVIDGDTITVELSSGPIAVRLDSIDAPERNQPWGKESGAALAEILQGRKVVLDVQAQDRYERLVAVVYLGVGSVNARMVELGHAWAYREYLSDPEYCALEHEARRARRGLWGQWRPAAPWEWRRSLKSFSDYSDDTVAECISVKGHSSSTRAASSRSSDQSARPCLIKGNISGNGRIYHTPGSANYESTRIDESKGERWFCTEAEAKAAGWRPPMN